jgi:ferredoxin
LYALSINVAQILATEFEGMLPIAYSGGIDDKNIKEVLETGISPITLSSFLLKPKGYKNIGKLLVDVQIPKKIDTVKLTALAEKAITDKNYDRKNVKVYECKPNYSEFCAACHSCEDVCPNRANRRMNINGKDVVLHDPDLCNECGACAYNCIMGHKPYLEKACTIEPPSMLSNNFSFYFIGLFFGIIALLICTYKKENKKYILIISLIGSSLISILPKFISMSSCCLLSLYCAAGFFNGFIYVYSILWIEQFGKQNKKIELMSIIPLIIGSGIFIAYNYQPCIPCIQCGVLCLSCIFIFLSDNNSFNSSIILFKSGSKYYNIETLDENENKEYARESLFRKSEKEDKKILNKFIRWKSIYLGKHIIRYFNFMLTMRFR